MRILEDMGFEVIDNLPFSLFDALLEQGTAGRSMALSVDVRNRDFSGPELVRLLDQVCEDSRIEAEVLFLDATLDVLINRYSESRRRHPLSPEGGPRSGLTRELEMLAPARARATARIDTSHLSPHELRSELHRVFGTGHDPGIAITVTSFSYKQAMPLGVDLAFDMRFLRNPHWEAELRSLTGLDPAVQDYVKADPRFADQVCKIYELVEALLPEYNLEGKTHLNIAFGCTGGQHRSVTVTEWMRDRLEKAGWRVSTRHSVLERRTQVAWPGRGAQP
ncbi:RNase adapter RapZ [Palleronia caenipelagi]|uniref:RNase adapter RapZ n=2 Tax=Palleronia caenipelagi TaxID=2489174 RepID=A0A547QB72_9RHOB|nr:RNase adapter RapZ [Palleronia caenipelagi]TRD23632.1 RNase adapter RapZ [Palleronia caenipelagi]